MKKPSSDLHTLIHAMTKAEKRQFKLQASLVGGEGVAVRLFDAIAAQKVYDEKKIRTQFAGEGFLKQLTTAKHGLYQQLLRCLHLHHRDDPEAKLYEQMHHVKLLIFKGLYDQADRALTKLKTAALEAEAYPVLLAMRWMEVRLIERSADRPRIRHELPALFTDNERYLDHLSAEMTYHRLFVSSALTSYVKGSSRSDSEFRTMDEAMQMLEALPDDTARTFRSNQYRESFLGVYHRGKQNLQESYDNRRAIIDRFEANPYHQENNPQEYIAAAFNLAALCSDMWRYDEVFAITARLRAFTLESTLKRNQSLQATTMEYVIRLELYAYPRLGTFSEGLKAVPETETLIAQRGPLLHSNTAALLYYNLAYLYFGAGQPRLALRWLHRLFNEYPGSREDVRGYARILELIIRYEQRDQDYLEYAVRSAYRYLLKRGRAFKTEQAMLRFFRKEAPHIHTEADAQQAFRRLHGELTELFKEVFERKILHNFDLLSWLESQFEEVPFAELTARQYRQNILG